LTEYVLSASVDGRDDEKLWLFGPLAYNSLRESSEGEIFLFFRPQAIEKSRFRKGNERK
jgi:hypothetical protein